MKRKLSMLMCIALLIGLIPVYGGKEALAAEPANVMQLVSGYYHDVGLTTSGKMLGWGGNEFGGLADGTDVNRSKPVTAKGMTEVASVAAGVRQSFAVKKDGTVWAWGSNNHGQLGDGTTTNQWLPVQLAIDDVASLSGGIGYHTLALKKDGTVWAWGKNDSGELGDGTTTSRSVPAKVPGLTDMTAVSAGGYHSIALKADGTVWAWGLNSAGEMGNGTESATQTTPVQVTGLDHVIAISAGNYHNLALKENGTVWAWGENSWGAVGDGTTTKRIVPVQVQGISDVVAVSAGGWHSLALKADGTLWAWGYNNLGQVGDGTTTTRKAPVQVTGLTDVSQIAAGAFHSGVLRSDGSFWGWGFNDYGQLGNGTVKDSSVPAQSLVWLDDTAPALGSGTISAADVTTDSATLSWTKATDNLSGQADLQYRLYRSFKNNIQTVADMESKGIAVNAYTADIASLPLTGLIDGMPYYFNVIVKDKAGNKTAYTMQQVVTVAIPTYSVIYRGNGNTGGKVPVDDYYYYEDEEAEVLGNARGLIKAGYTFADWNTKADGTGTAYKEGDLAPIGQADLVLYAQWTKNPTYKVLYDGNGETGGMSPVDNEEYEAGATATVLSNAGGFVKNGYSFAGWNTKPDGDGTPYAADAALILPAANVTLYAQWTLNPTYGVTYEAADADSGSVPVDAGAYEEGAEVTVQGNTGNLVRAGYTIAGWTLAANGNGTVYKAGDKLTMGGADITLHAKWTANPTYSVTYEAAEADSGSVPVDAGAYEEGAEVTVQGNTGNLSRAGYTFAGWTLAADGNGTVYKAGDKLTMGGADITLHANWTANPTYGVTYEAADADSGNVPVDASAYEEGAELTVQGNTGNLSRAGYTFAGWTLAADGGGTVYKAGDKLTMGTADITLHAKWTANPTYGVIYEAADADSGSVPVDASAYEEGAELTVQGNTGNLSRAGYTFAGWTLAADGGGTVYKAGDKLTMGTADVTLHAKWTANPTYGVIYEAADADSGSVPVDAGAYEEGTEVTVQGNTGNLSRAGYTLAGWTLSADGGGTVYKTGDKLTMGTADVTLHAKWTANPTYGVIYEAVDADSGSVPVDASAYGEGAEVTVQGNTGNLSRAGYTFAGWTLAADGGGTVYKAGDKLTMGTADITLHAKWAANPTYGVTYEAADADSGSAPVDAGAYEEGVEVTVQGNTGNLTKTGYTFAGWTLAADGGGTVYKVGDKLTMGTADITLHAKWTANPTYGVTYEAADADSGSVPVDAGAYEEGAEVTVQGNAGNLSRAGYTFAGWTLAANGNGTVYKAGDKLTMGGADITLHAKWTANPTYSVTYEAAEADSGSVPVDAGAYEEGAELTVQGNAGNLSRAGYTFAGWTLSADGGGTVYKAGDKLTIGRADIQLYAKWNIEAGGGPDPDPEPDPDPDPDPVAAPKLTSLHLSAGQWSAAFSPGTAEYTITMSADVDSVDVTAAAANERQSVTASVYDGEGVRIGGPFALGAQSRSITLAASAASVQIEVVAEDGKGFIYLLHIQREKTQEPEMPTPPPAAPIAPTPPPFKLTIGGTEHSLVGTATMNAQDLDVQLLSSALTAGLSAAAEGALIAITAPDDALSLTVRFDASALATMKAKRASLALVTSQGSYTLPIANLPVETTDGAAYSLSVRQGGAATALQLSKAAADKGYVIIGSPVTFELSMTRAGEAKIVDSFNTFVKRELPLPAGSDPAGVTAVVVEPDGTLRPVPTEIVERDGRYYAVIRSLTNSAYALVRSTDVGFADLSGHWAREAIDDMAKRLIVNGYANGDFRPNAAVSRAEFAAMLIRALGLPQTGEAMSAFTDVKVEAWYGAAVGQAAAYSLLYGGSDGRFRPDESITREEAFTVVMRAAKLAGTPGMTASEDAERILLAFADGAAIHGWAREDVAGAVQAGLIQGAGGRLAPAGAVTRAETAVILRRLLVQADLIRE